MTATRPASCLGLQIKTGPSWFGEPCEGGWKLQLEKKHISYWLNHSLPVYVLLVDLDTEAIYWQEISERTLQTGPQGGIFVEVPEANVIATAREPWETAAEKFASTAAEDYDDNLGLVGTLHRRHHPGPCGSVARWQRFPCCARTSREGAAHRSSPCRRCSPACRTGW